MKKTCYLIFLFSTIGFSSSSIAQNDAYIIRYDGIPSNASVFEIKVLSDNTKIVATDIGIYAITRFDQAAKRIAEGSYNSVVGEQQDDLWAGLINGKLKHLSSGTYISLSEKPVAIRSIVKLNVLIWVGTDKGIFVVNTRNNKVIRHHQKGDHGLRTNDIRFIHADPEYLWIGTSRGIHRIKDDQWKHYEKNKRMEVIFNNHEGNWLISEDEMWVIDPFQRWYPAAINKGLKQGPIRALTIDQSGKLYLASEKLVRYDPYTETIHDYESSIGTLSKKCMALACDSNDDIWIGTSMAGLYMIRFELEENIPFSTSIIQEQSIICEGARATILAEINGGKEPYTIKWNNGETVARLTAALPGEYSVRVTDVTGDTSFAFIQILGPNPIQINIVEKKAISGPGRNDGKISILIEGGKAPYSIQWDNGESGYTASQLSSGDHKLTITDENGCNTVQQIGIEHEKFIPNLDISQITVGQTLLINELYFQADSTEVMENSYDVLEEIFDFLSTNPKVVIEIGGHTNNIPPHEYCDKLSSERARNVALYLFNRGISEDRISYKGYGKRNPIASNESLAGRKKNQRVEIKVLSIK